MGCQAVLLTYEPVCYHLFRDGNVRRGSAIPTGFARTVNPAAGLDEHDRRGLTNRVVALSEDLQLESVFQSLTRKQHEVMGYVAAHFTSKQIAFELGISVSAVNQRIEAVRARAGSPSRAELARAYREFQEGEDNASTSASMPGLVKGIAGREADIALTGSDAGKAKRASVDTRVHSARREPDTREVATIWNTADEDTRRVRSVHFACQFHCIDPEAAVSVFAQVPTLSGAPFAGSLPCVVGHDPRAGFSLRCPPERESRKSRLQQALAKVAGISRSRSKALLTIVRDNMAYAAFGSSLVVIAMLGAEAIGFAARLE